MDQGFLSLCRWLLRWQLITFIPLVVAGFAMGIWNGWHYFPGGPVPIADEFSDYG